MQGEWIRSGTVTVTQGEALVIGIATAWQISGVIIGDFFIGPDGKYPKSRPCIILGPVLNPSQMNE